MDRLSVPKPNDRMSVKWAQQIVDEIRRQNIIPGNGIKKTVNANGTVISLDLPSESGGEADPAKDSCFPVFITHYTDGFIFKGMEFKIVGSNSRSNDSELLFFPHVTPSTKVPVGTAVLAHRIAAPLILSSDD